MTDGQPGMDRVADIVEGIDRWTTRVLDAMVIGLSGLLFVLLN